MSDMQLYGASGTASRVKVFAGSKANIALPVKKEANSVC